MLLKSCRELVGEWPYFIPTKNTAIFMLKVKTHLPQKGFIRLFVNTMNSGFQDYQELTLKRVGGKWLKLSVKGQKSCCDDLKGNLNRSRLKCLKDATGVNTVAGFSSFTKKISPVHVKSHM